MSIINLNQKSTSLSLGGLAFIKEPSFGEVLGTFTDLTSLRYLYSIYISIRQVQLYFVPVTTYCIEKE